MINIAVFPAGTEIGLEINRALKFSTHINLHGLSSVQDHAKLVYRNHFDKIPFYTENEFISILNDYILKHKISYISPAHDDVQLFLTENEHILHAKVITSEINTVRICRSKIKTYDFFSDCDFVPFNLDSNSISDKSNLRYPLFAKPDVGQGAKGVAKISSEKELKLILDKQTNLVLCEYLPGEEYTIDCFTDNNGKLRICNMRNRARIKSGISVNSKLLKMDSLVSGIAETINSRLNLRGAWFFQLKKDFNNDYKLLEIAPRVSGTMGLSRNTGINYPLLSIFDRLNSEIKIIKNNYDIEVDRALFSRYILNFSYKYIYVDLDDTIIVRNKVNSILMMFLYQSLNNGKIIYLITKHEYSVSETLNKFNISSSIFTNVIHINKEEKKSKYIKNLNSIFIDDSFSERYDVLNNAGIPVFDVSEIEALIDWRI